MIIKKIIQQYFKGLRAQVLFYPLMVVKNNRPPPRRPAKNFRPPLEVPRRILDPPSKSREEYQTPPFEICEEFQSPPFGNCEQTATPPEILRPQPMFLTPPLGGYRKFSRRIIIEMPLIPLKARHHKLFYSIICYKMVI